jgi:hypothetical protein
MRQQRASLRNPPKSVEQYLVTLEQQGLSKFSVSSDIRFWSSGDTKTGPADGLLIEALRRLLDRCFIGV